MKIFGIELKGNDVILVVIESNNGIYEILESKVKKIKLNDSDIQEDVKIFTSELYSYLAKEGCEYIAIKARAKKGKFAGGSVSFKIEGILQNSLYPVSLYSGVKIKSKLKNKEIDTSTVNAYQTEALRAAICLSMDL